MWRRFGFTQWFPRGVLRFAGNDLKGGAEWRVTKLACANQHCRLCADARVGLIVQSFWKSLGLAECIRGRLTAVLLPIEAPIKPVVMPDRRRKLLFE